MHGETMKFVSVVYLTTLPVKEIILHQRLHDS